jgi:hypothetical protein
MTIRAQVVIDIGYDKENVTTIEKIETALSASVRHLANNGLLADPYSVVDGWSYSVDVYEVGEDGLSIKGVDI